MTCIVIACCLHWMKLAYKYWTVQRWQYHTEVKLKTVMASSHDKLSTLVKISQWRVPRFLKLVQSFRAWMPYTYIQVDVTSYIYMCVNDMIWKTHTHTCVQMLECQPCKSTMYVCTCIIYIYIIIMCACVPVEWWKVRRSWETPWSHACHVQMWCEGGSLEGVGPHPWHLQDNTHTYIHTYHLGPVNCTHVYVVYSYVHVPKHY